MKHWEHVDSAKLPPMGGQRRRPPAITDPKLPSRRSSDELSSPPDGGGVSAVREAAAALKKEMTIFRRSTPGVNNLAGGTDGVQVPAGRHLGGDRGGVTSKAHSPSWTSRRVTWVMSIDIADIGVDSMAIDPTGDRLALRPRRNRPDRGSRSRPGRAGRRPRCGVGRAVGRVDPRRTRRLASGSFDNLVHVFDTEDFADTPLPGSPNLVAQVAFAPDSSRLASISAGELRFWALAPKTHPALGNFNASGAVRGTGRRPRRVGSGGHHPWSRRVGNRRTNRHGDR